MRQSTRVFLRFFLSYLLIMLLPFGITLRVYNDEARRTSDDIYAKDILLLEQGQRTMDYIIGSMNDMMQSLSSNVAVKSLMNYESIYENRRRLTDYINVRDSLQEFNQFSYVDAFFIYAYHSDTLINGTQILYDASAGNLRYLLPAGTDDASVRRMAGMLLTTRYQYEFLPIVNMTPLGNMIVASDYVPYACTITNSTYRNALNAVLLLDVNKLRKRLGFVDDTGWLYCGIQTLSGQTVLESGTAYEFDGEFTGDTGYARGSVNGQSALISYVIDNEQGLRYTSASSMAQIDALVSESRRSLLIMILCTGAVALLLAVLAAMRTTAPLRRLLLGLDVNAPADSPAVEYANLDKALNQIMTENATLKNEMSIQAPLLRGALVSRWLHGEYANVDDVFEAYARVGYELNMRMYAVIIVAIPARRINGASIAERGPNVGRALVKALLRENVPELIDIVDMNVDAFVFVAGTDGRNKEEWRRALGERLTSLYDLLLSQVQLEPTFYAALASDANRVHTAYVELNRAYGSDGGQGGSTSIRWLSDKSPESDGIYFPVELELRIADAIKNGDESELNGAFSRLYTENAIKRPVVGPGSLSDDELKQLRAVLDAMFIRLGCEGLETPGQVPDMSPAEQLLSLAQKRLLALCGLARAEHVSRQEELRLAIEKYVRANFADPQLSLTAAADALGYTQAYISRVFKQQTGELFSAYVERLRMERAQELLRQGELPVYKVAEECGYNSVQVFRRAFAKVCGTSPSNYAEISRESAQN